MFEGHEQPSHADARGDANPEAAYGQVVKLGTHHVLVYAAPPGVISIDPATRIGTAPRAIPSCP